MRIMYHLENETEKITNFNIAQSVIELCDEDFKNEGLDAEVVAKMMLLQIDARRNRVLNELPCSY